MKLEKATKIYKARFTVPVLGHIMKRVGPRMHAALAGAATVQNTENKVARFALKFFYGILNIFCPTLHFVYKKSEMQCLENEEALMAQGPQLECPRFISDEDYGNVAYKTPDVLTADHIGLVGLCKHARWDDIKQTVKAKPGQVLLGSIQLIVSCLNYFWIGNNLIISNNFISLFKANWPCMDLRKFYALDCKKLAQNGAKQHNLDLHK